MADTALDNLSSLSATRMSGARRVASPTTVALEKQKSEGWVEWLRCIALGVFVSVPIFAWFEQALAGRAVWTIVVASLPLFIVIVGYHRWRRICPLAFFGKLPETLGFGGKRVVPAWLEKNYHCVALGFFIFGLWMRHIAINGDGAAIAIFFAGIALCAFVTGTIYTGKSWCNFICPVLFIEKIYTEPHGLRETANSQCGKCTACKKFCPDINQENGYWKELNSPTKRIAYFSFPGLVFGFYFYFYLQAGTWDAYFVGKNWVDRPGVWRTAFFPGNSPDTAGFYFWPAMPRAAAAMLTLVLCGALSFALFLLLKRPVRVLLKSMKMARERSRLRHTLYSIAGFTAFVTFYSFAGQPTLRMIDPAPHFFLIVVVLTSAIYLARRLSRTQRAFAEESLAKNIVKRWEWPDPAPSDLHDAFLIHTVRSKESERASERALEIYKDSLREALAEGIVTREELHRIQALRDQLQIKKSDHAKIMSALDEEARALLSDPSKLISAEKRLQLENYQHALENYLERAFAPGAQADGALIAQLREEYRVTAEEHNQVLEDLMSGERGIGGRLAEAVGSIECAAHAIVALEREPSPAHDFLRDILERRRARAVATLAKGLTLDSKAHTELADDLCSNDAAKREAAIERLARSIVPVLGDRLVAARREMFAQQSAMPSLFKKILERTHSRDPYERALAVYVTGESGEASEKDLVHVANDESPVVRNTVVLVKSKHLSGLGANWKQISLSTVDKMIALRSTPIFSRLEPESLERLANACKEGRYDPGQPLCIEGESGNEVFILVEGGVDVVRGEGENRKLLAQEKAGGFIGELAVLDPAPRSATVLAGAKGVYVLRLDGWAFRDALHHDSSIAEEVLRTLAQRLKKSRG